MSATGAEAAPWWRGAWKLALGLAIFAALCVALAGSGRELLDRVHFEPPLLLAGFVASSVAIWATASRWKLLNEAWGNEPHPFAVYVYQLSLTRVLGMLTSAVAMDLVGRSVALKASGSRSGLGRLVVPVLFERVLDVAIPVVMVAWALAVVVGPLHAWPLTSFAVLCLVTIPLAAPLLAPLVGVALRAWRSIARLRGRDVTIEAPVVDGGVAWRTSALSVARYVAVCFQFLTMGAACGVHLPAAVVLAAAPVAQLSVLVGITPGGLGITEAGWAGALLWQGVDETDVALFLLATRALTLANFAVATALTWPWMKRATRS